MKDSTSEEVLTGLFTDAVWDSIPRKNGCRHPLVMREFGCGRGRADVVCAVFRGKRPDSYHGRRLGMALSQPGKAKILSWLDKSSPRTETYIEGATGFTTRTVRRHLRELASMGLVEETDKGLVRLSRSFVLPNIEVWAFELKLHNWKRAFYQALRYRAFSHNIMVVIPSDNLEVARRNLTMFTTMNVGLAEIDEGGRVKFVFRPRKGHPSSRELYLCGLGRILSRFCQLYPDSGSEVT